MVSSSLILLAGIALAGWGALLAMIVMRSRTSDRVQAGSTVTDEPPAVAALLCSRAVVPERAVTATYLDLLARGFFRRTLGADGQARIESRAAADAGLRPYERHVLNHVAARAGIGGGLVPEGALYLESTEHAKAWTTTFSDQVVADARARGLVMERISLSQLFWLWVGLLVPAGLVLAAGVSVWPCLLTYVVLAWPARKLQRPHPTDAGREAAAALRALGASRSEGRTAAYAVALGLNDPGLSLFAPQSDRTVWSNASGIWRQLRIIDPPSFPTGVDPVMTLYSIPGGLLFFVIWSYLLFWFTTDPKWGIPAALLIAGWLLWACLSFLFGRFVYRGLYDLSHDPVTVIGRVVYLEASNAPDSEEPGKCYYVALDDGQTEAAVTYEIGGQLFAKLRHGDRLRLEVTPKLRCVKAAQFDSVSHIAGE